MKTNFGQCLWIIVAVLLAATPERGRAESLHEYCSGPGKDYRECMQNGELSQGLSQGLRDYCSRRGMNFRDCVERYIDRGSIEDMSAYCSQPGRAYRSCMDELLEGRRRGYSREYQSYRAFPNYGYQAPRRSYDTRRYDGHRGFYRDHRRDRYDRRADQYWERDSYWDLRTRRW